MLNSSSGDPPLGSAIGGLSPVIFCDWRLRCQGFPKCDTRICSGRMVRRGLAIVLLGCHSVPCSVYLRLTALQESLNKKRCFRVFFWGAGGLEAFSLVGCTVQFTVTWGL